MKKYFSLLRAHQWIKNILIFAPIMFSRELFVMDKSFSASLAFIIFCLLASSVYIFNDTIDAEKDAKHPIKKKRPIAAGIISKRQAIIILIFLLALTILLLVFMPKMAIISVIYLLVNLAYSLYLKKLIIIDIITITSFYIMRIAAGGIVTETIVSAWLNLCIIFLSLFIVTAKRKAEYAHSERREVLEIYSEKLLDYFLIITSSLTIIAYSLYIVLIFKSTLALYSIFFVIFWIFYYLHIVYSGNSETETPEKIIFKDKKLLLSIIGWMIFMIFILYMS